MANGFFDEAKNAFLQGGIDWVADDIRCVLIDTDTWGPNFTTDTHLDDVPPGARTATSASLTGKSVAASSGQASDVTFVAVTGSTSEGVLIYRHTGVESTSVLIAFYDTGIAGVPVLPDGSDITCRWNGGVVIAF